MNDEGRFWSKVDKSGGPDACWLWTAGRLKQGYGHFRVGSKMILAHRFAWESINGPISDGLHGCHKCDNPPCVNPAHLFFGSNAANVADRQAKGRQASGDRSGSRLHPESRPRGDKHGRAKLTEAQVVEIRALYAAGEGTLHDLGRRFGVSRSTVRYAVRGKSWKHLKEEKQ